MQNLQHTPSQICKKQKKKVWQTDCTGASIVISFKACITILFHNPAPCSRLQTQVCWWRQACSEAEEERSWCTASWAHPKERWPGQRPLQCMIRSRTAKCKWQHLYYAKCNVSYYSKMYTVSYCKNCIPWVTVANSKGGMCCIKKSGMPSLTRWGERQRMLHKMSEGVIWGPKQGTLEMWPEYGRQSWQLLSVASRGRCL
jgi:hypothetical protein